MTATRGVAFAAAVALAVGCYKNIDQAADTGEDGDWEGAEPISLDPKSGVGSIEDTVSYPDGDRIDWSSVQLPDGQTGAVTIELKWVAPRNGLDLSFIVYDQYGRKVASEKPKKKRPNKKRGKKSTSLGGASGMLYIEVYASERRDAGDYELTVSFSAMAVPQPGDKPLDVPMPPRIAAVYPPCDLNNIDPANPDCVGKKAPVAAKPCDPKKLDRDNPDCIQYYEDCNPKKWDAANPKCDDVEPWVEPPPEPISAIITDWDPSGDFTKIIINAGSADGVAVGWTGYMVDKDGKKVEKGAFTIESVKKNTSNARVKASETTVKKNPSVRLNPPPVSPP